jgi:predicted transcriptional regulator
MREQIDLKFRIFLLTLLERRELTFSQIRGSIMRDYTEQKYLKQEVNRTLVNLHVNGLIVRRKLRKEEREDQGRYSYTITDRGGKRREYYQERLDKQGT